MLRSGGGFEPTECQALSTDEGDVVVIDAQDFARVLK